MICLANWYNKINEPFESRIRTIYRNSFTYVDCGNAKHTRYWEKSLQYKTISKVMPIRRFEQIN